MYEDIKKWREARLGFDKNNRPVILEINDKGGNTELKKKLMRNPSSFKNLKITRLGGMDKRPNIKKTDKVMNRKWKVLEYVRKNQPVPARYIAEEAADGKNFAPTYIINLYHNQWLKREVNNIYKNLPKIYLYSLGFYAKKHLKRLGIKSFLYPENPYDYGPNGERML